MANFLWGSNSNQHIHWVSWKSVCQPKNHGGLGMFDVRLRSKSLLNKWLRRFVSENVSLWRKVVDAKYNFDERRLLPKEATAEKKVGKVIAFGTKLNGRWVWSMETRSRAIYMGA
ncbi:hypothetical protein GQ457_16G011960 [Hibiscus cannabinus]